MTRAQVLIHDKPQVARVRMWKTFSVCSVCSAWHVLRGFCFLNVPKTLHLASMRWFLAHNSPTNQVLLSCMLSSRQDEPKRFFTYCAWILWYYILWRSVASLICCVFIEGFHTSRAHSLQESRHACPGRPPEVRGFSDTGPPGGGTHEERKLSDLWQL